MRNLFKTLGVLLAVMSLGFMGASIAMYYGHPDALAEMNSPAMQAYSFEANPGEKVTWTVTARDGANAGQNIGTFDSPLLAVNAAHKDLQSRLSTETNEANSAADVARQQTAAFTASQAQDLEAARQRKQMLDGFAQNLEQRLRQLNTQEQSLAERAKQIQLETASRRTDVTRLQNELEEARTDLFRLTEIRRELTNELLRLQLETQSLQERITQMGSQ